MRYYYLSSWSAYSSFIPINGELKDLQNLPSLSCYTPIEVCRYDDPKPRRKGGDLVNSSPVIVSDYFKKTMDVFLDEKGDFHPLITEEEDQDYWIFKVKNSIDILDFDRCKGFLNPWFPDRSEVKYSALRSFSIKRPIPIDPIIFQVPQYGESYTFVSENFVEEIKKNKVSGVAVFGEDVDWLDTKPTILNKNVK